MSLLKALEKKLEEAKRAAAAAALERATRIAIDKGVATGRTALAETSKRLQQALFGADDDKTGAASGTTSTARPTANSPARPPKPPEPTAEQRSAREAREVDDELAALKKKIARER